MSSIDKPNGTERPIYEEAPPRLIDNIVYKCVSEPAYKFGEAVANFVFDMSERTKGTSERIQEAFNK